MNDTGRGDTEASQAPYAERDEAAAAGDAPAGGEAEAPPSPGERLRRAREAQGRTARAVASSLKLPAGRIEALERDDDASLPPPTFVRGYLRSYAQLVGCDPEAVLAAYDRRRSEVAEEPGQGAPPRPGSALPEGEPLRRGRPGAGRWLRRLVVIAGLAALLAAAGGGVLLLLPGGGAEEAPAPADSAGEQAFAGLVEGPERIALAPAERYELVIGNAQLVAVEHAGEPVDLAPHTRDRVARLTLTESE